MICVVNSTTSFMAGFIVFSILGHISHILGVQVQEMAASGPELIFVSLPQGTVSMPGKNPNSGDVTSYKYFRKQVLDINA